MSALMTAEKMGSNFVMQLALTTAHSMVAQWAASMVVPSVEKLVEMTVALLAGKRVDRKAGK